MIAFLVATLIALTCAACASQSAHQTGQPPEAPRTPAQPVETGWDSEADAGHPEALQADIQAYLARRDSRSIFAAASPGTGADLAAAAQNPIASTISVPFESNFQFGADGGLQYVLNIQPVIPHAISENWNLIHRPIVPVVYNSATILGAPHPPASESSEWGIGDTLYAPYFSPRKSGKWTWGLAPAIQLPTSTSRDFGTGEWGLGASAVALQIRKPWLYGVLVTNVWSLESSSSAFLLQPFVAYNLSDGWFLETGPQFTANWSAPSDERWQIPLGGGVGKITKIGSQPIALRLHFYWNVERPPNGPEALLRFTVTFLFPKGKQ